MTSALIMNGHAIVEAHASGALLRADLDLNLLLICP